MTPEGCSSLLDPPAVKEPGIGRVLFDIRGLALLRRIFRLGMLLRGVLLRLCVVAGKRVVAVSGRNRRHVIFLSHCNPRLSVFSSCRGGSSLLLFPSKIDCSASGLPIVDLPPGGGKRVLDRDLDMFVARVVGPLMIDHDIFVRRNCKANMNLETAAVAGLVAGRDHAEAATDDAIVVSLQAGYFALDGGARGLRRLAPLESHL